MLNKIDENVMRLKNIYENSNMDTLQRIKEYILNIDMSKHIFDDGKELLYSEDGLYIEIFSDMATTNTEQFKNIIVGDIFPIVDRYWKFVEDGESVSKNEDGFRVEILTISFNDVRLSIEYVNSNVCFQLDNKFIKKVIN